MRKAPLADDFHVVFCALCNHGLNPWKFSRDLILPISASACGAFLAYSRPSEPSKLNCAQKRGFRRPATSTGPSAALLRANRDLRTLNGAESNSSERRRFGIAAGGRVADALNFDGRFNLGCCSLFPPRLPTDLRRPRYLPGASEARIFELGGGAGY
ncbi:hypothetical protein C8R43DRAFT_1031244 [Mycena crocata]|nr:hypothetical protein C8R43DRAFT_1031244 [Mycena crocata]